MGVATDVKTLSDVFEEFWAARLWILGAVFLGVISATVFVRFAVPHYKSHMIISPASPMSGVESSSVLEDENLFALRYFMQRVGSNSSSGFLRFENTFSGARVAEILLSDPEIIQSLDLDQRFSFSVSRDGWSAAKLSSYIKKRVRLEHVGTSPLRRLVYTHPRPDSGRYVLNAVHRVTDDLIREIVRGEADQRVAHLQKSIRGHNNPEHRRALTSLLMEQERLLMLTAVEAPYTATIIEPAASSARPVWPSKVLVYVLFVGGFALLGFVAHGGMMSRRSMCTD